MYYYTDDASEIKWINGKLTIITDVVINKFWMRANAMSLIIT